MAKELSDKARREDMATVRDVCDVALWQEIDDPAKHEALDTTLPPVDWTHLARVTECPISTRRALLRVTDRGHIQISKGREGVSPHRVMSWAVVDVVGSQMPPFVLANTHFVSGAFTNPGQVGDDDGWRKETWVLNFAACRAKIREWRELGLTVIVGGDFNRKADMPMFFDDQQWIVHDASYDKLLCLPGSVTVEPQVVDRITLRSDHDARVARLRLSAG